jgi:hypothetical protein
LWAYIFTHVFTNNINNFVKFGYSDQIVYVVGKNVGKNISPQLKGILDNTPVEYHVYDDTRMGAKYPSSLRPHILQKYFEEFPELSGETFFYVDPDMYFTDNIDFEPLLTGNTWYLSDTRSYIDSSYIKSKGEQLFKEMALIVGLDEQTIIDNDNNAGGAQYLIKNIGEKYWRKVYLKSEVLYKHMKNTESVYSPQHPIQSWTADMWSVLWNAWKFNHQTKIIPELSFSWATDPITKLNENNLFHNAGVAKQTNLFNKVAYQTNPFDKDLSHVSPDYCSHYMVSEIEETKNNYPDLVVLF